MKKDRVYITTPIYYVNDKPHIGHAYTTVAADVLARYWRLKLGEDQVFFLTGTDEHGTKVAQSAKKAGKKPQEFCDQMSKLFKTAWQNLNINYDDFVRTTNSRHEKAVKKFMDQLFQNKTIYSGKYEGLYCTGCEKFMTEKELVDGLCPAHQKPPEKLVEKNYFFKLKDYLKKVEKLIKEDKVAIKPPSAKNETLGLFKQGLADFSVSREKVKWGIDLPFDKKQKIYVWVEALQNYISAIGYGDNPKEFKKWWGEARVIHLMAKDIIKFHAIFWPALLLAAGEKPPEEEFIHGFFTINGQKMSKSLGNMIDPNDLVKKYGADATRYLLLSQFPFGQDGDIKAEKFDEQYNADLANNLGNLVSRVLNMVEKYCTGKIPIKNDTLKIFPGYKFETKVNGYIESFEFDQGLKSIWQAINEANQYIDKQKPWELAKQKKEKAKLNLVISALANFFPVLARTLEPFMPESAKEIETRFGAKKITPGKPLFPRIK